MKYFFVAVLSYIFFVHTGFMSISNSVGEIYTPSDEEVNFINVQSTLKGEGLYKGFSIVYPPGRFLIQALFFKIFGTSIPTTAFYFALIPGIFFPTFLFFLSYKIFKKIRSSFVSFILAVITVLISQFFINSAQDIHVFSALFFIVLLSEFKSSHIKNMTLGVLLGVIFLFRIEAGIFIILSIIISCFEKRKEYKKLFPSLIGFMMVWIPMLIYIFFTGSLKNFFYDILYLGLIMQPKMMGLPIPPPPVGLIFLSILIYLSASTLSLFIKAKDYTGIRIFAIFSALSYVSAIDRSDEGHLWYASVWLPFYISYFLSEFINFKNYIRRNILAFFIPVGLIFFAFGYFILKLKSTSFFIIIIVIIFWFFTKKFWKNYASLILISGVLASLAVFHSLSFLKIRFSGLPRISFNQSLSAGIFQSQGDKIAGLRFSQSYMNVLKKIKEKLDVKNKWLFIFPDNVIFYDYFKLKNPTRYYLHTNQTTNGIQKEIINKLEVTKTNNFIFFPENATFLKEVRRWILDKTRVVQTYKLGNKKVELRKRI
ncbi:MAG: hypothetical protein ACD_12C00421G0001 [uncultured bacterium]|nr:MAG: hypothetical protein ACD_12C00421G0001 [uncultured bacterium]